MIFLNKKLILPLLLLLLLLPAGTVEADTGPKPTMAFEFIQPEATAPLTIVSGILYECRQSDCSDAQPLQEGGPQGFRCTAESCNALAYGFAPYHKIEIEFSDGKTRASNVFKTAGFESKYKVTVQLEGLLVEAQFNPRISPWGGMFFLLCSCLCGIVLILALVFFLIRRFSRK